jgi:hypothetical protein
VKSCHGFSVVIGIRRKTHQWHLNGDKVLAFLMVFRSMSAADKQCSDVKKLTELCEVVLSFLGDHKHPQNNKSNCGGPPRVTHP